MIYKILENTGVEIENVDGAAFNNFVIAGKNCIIKGVLDECKVVKTSSNSFILSKGLLIIQGVRIKILEEQLFTMTSTPSENGEYQIVAEIELTANRVVNFSLYVAPKSELVKSALFATEAGVYQIEFGRFIYTTSGVIENLQTTLPVAYGTPETVGTPVDGLTVVQDEEGQNLLYLTFEGETVGEGIPLPQGGGGGGGGSSNNALLRVNNTTGWLSKTFSAGSDVELKFNWSSVEEGLPTGNGTLKIYVGGSLKNSYEIQQGDVVVDVTKYITAGANDIKLEVADVYDNSRRLSYTINSVSVSLSSYFDGTTARTGAITYSYIPVGAVEKTVIFLIDGQSIGTQMVTPSGREQTFTIPAQPHGSHTFEVYFTATIDNQVVESNHLYYDLICYVDGNSKPIISVPAKITTAEQYSTVAIPYIVYTPNQLESDVILNDGAGNEAKLKVDRTLQKWPYKAVNSGAVSLSIISGETRKQLDFTVKETKIDVSAETENLQLYLSSVGRNNKEENPLTWGFGDINASFTGFNLVSDGWQLDENNNTVLRVAGDARVHIPFNIFETDARSTGKTIEIEFATRNVLNYDAEIITTWSNERGIKITAQKALLKSEQTEIFTQYKENETVRIAFVVGKQAEHRLLYIYINGIMSGVVQYATDDDFQQNPPVGISIGSNDCTTDIYTIRVYGNNLNRFQVLDNWIADTQDLTQMSDRYTRNNIFDDYDNIVVSKLPDDLPYLVLDVDSYGELPQSKGDKKTISGKYVDPLHANRSFDFSAAEIDVQGTSSQYYPRKNYKIKFKGGFIIAGNVVDTYKLRDTSMPTNEFTFKADVASSEGANNVELVRLYDDTCPVKTPPQEADSRVRQGIEGYPILMFYGNDSNLTFLGKYNFNNDKATPEVFGLKTGDESWEILQNNTDMVIWKDDDFSGTAWKQSFEARYPDGNTNTAKLQEFSSWLKSTDTTAVTTDYEKQQRIQKFKDEFANYANVDAMLFNYIFTEMFLMVDNRAKNAFPTRYDEDGKWLILPYDYDTAIGINNEGELKFGYELEDTDLIDGKNVFNGQDSVLYVNMRLAFADEIMEMYRDLRRGDVFSYEELEKRFEEHQSVWGEAVFNEDAKFKYIDPLVNAGEAAYLPMLQGSKAQQRKWWLYNRFRYIDSKYNAGDALEDFIVVRAYNVADIEVTPYADIYASAKFDSALVQKRALRKDGTQTLENPLTAGNDAVISIYSASQLSAIGDLSGLKVGMADFSKATKLSELKVGDSSESYNNPNLTDLQIGNLTLLKKLDVRNCSALAQSVDASGCINIEEIYFDGTAITGLSLPNGGNLKKLHLPSTINNLTVLNQKQLSEFVLPTYSAITTLRVENTPLIDTFAIVNSIAANSRVRLVGINWTINNASDVLALMDKLDTMRGLDENGGNQDKAVVSGTIHVNELTDEQLAEMNARYPNITITYGALNVSVKFYNGDALISDLAVAEGEQITVPANPTKESTAQYHYNFAGWSLDGVNVVEVGVAGNQDLTYYAVFTQETRYYTIRFLNSDGTVLQHEQLTYGSMPVYDATTPVDPSGDDGEFIGWLPAISTVTADIDYIAQFYLLPRLAYTLNGDNASYTVTGIGTITDTEIVIPDTYKDLPVTDIGEKAFVDNTSITKVVIGNNVKTVGENAFWKCSSLRTVEMGSAVTTLEAWAFRNCISLESFEIPTGVTQLSQGLCQGCNSLTSITIPENVTFISPEVFSYCQNLTEIVFPKTLQTIGDRVTFGCDKLVRIVCRATTPPTVAFSGTELHLATNALIYVPMASVDAYKTATGWSEYADRIYGLPTEGLAYTLNSDNASYTVSGIGTATDTDIVIPSTHEGLPVTILNADRFYYNTRIASFILPDSIVEITGRFDTMANLRKITIGKGVNKLGKQFAFDCPSLNEIVVSDDNASLKSVNGNLYNKDGTTLIQYAAGKTDTLFVVPSGVVQISVTAFNHCKLEEIILSNSLSQIGESAFYRCSSLRTIEIPNSVTTINKSTFFGCTNCLEYDFSNHTSVPTLANTSAFNSINANAKIIVPNNLYNEWIAATNWSNYASYITPAPTEGLAYTLNSDNASYSVSGIGTATDTDIVIPSTYEGLPVTAVGGYAFNRNGNITSAVIPDSVTSIGDSAFGNCSKLTSVVIPDSVTSIDHGVFYNCSSLTSIEIPNSVTYIGNNAFYECTSLTSVTIGDSVTSIGTSAFYNCSSLTSVVIPDSVTSIGNEAFSLCGGLTSVIIGNSVGSIGRYAFNFCLNLTKYDFSSYVSVPTLSDAGGFGYINSSAKIIVPDALYDQWIAATNWSNYASYIIKASEYTEA